MFTKHERKTIAALANKIGCYIMALVLILIPIFVSACWLKGYVFTACMLTIATVVEFIILAVTILEFTEEDNDV